MRRRLGAFLLALTATLACRLVAADKPTGNAKTPKTATSERSKTNAAQKKTPAKTPTKKPVAKKAAAIKKAAVAKPTPEKPAPPPPPAIDPEAARFSHVNSLGMKFVRVGDVEFCIWPVRVADFEKYLAATASGAHPDARPRKPHFVQTPEHPV